MKHSFLGIKAIQRVFLTVTQLPGDRYAIPEMQNHIKLYNKHFADRRTSRKGSKRLASHNFIFDRYTLVEPDKDPRFLSENKGTIFPKNSKFTILDKALGEESHLSNFQDGLGYCSQIWDNGTKSRCYNVGFT